MPRKYGQNKPGMFENYTEALFVVVLYLVAITAPVVILAGLIKIVVSIF